MTKARTRKYCETFFVECRRFFLGGGLVIYSVVPILTTFDSRYEFRIADIAWTGRRIEFCLRLNDLLRTCSAKQVALLY